MKNGLIKTAGFLLVAVSVYFIWKSVDFITLVKLTDSVTPLDIFLFFALCILYFFINFLRAVNWSNLISIQSSKPGFSAAYAVSVYLRTEIIKYVPSNVMHFAGRQFMMRKSGVKDRYTAAASTADIVLVLAAAALSVIAGLYFLDINLPSHYIIQSTRFKIFILLSFTAGLSFLVMLAVKRRSVHRFMHRKTIFTILKGMLFSIIIFFINALIFTLIIHETSESAFHFKDFFFVWSGYSFCWAAGLIVPGAPGGLGIREALIVIVFGNIYGNDSMAISGIIMRIVSISGDMISFAASHLFHCKNKSES